MMKKKAQEEMVGFVLIIVLVAVIALIFLGISLRSNTTVEAQQSKEIDSLLTGIAQYTTDCEKPRDRQHDVEDVIVMCYNNDVCEDGRAACEVLIEDLRGIVESVYSVEQGSRVSYYSLSVQDSEKILVIQNITQGEECVGNLKYNERNFNVGLGGFLGMRLDVCFRN